MKEEGNEETFKDSNMKIVCFIHFYPLNSNQKNTKIFTYWLSDLAKCCSEVCRSKRGNSNNDKNNNNNNNNNRKNNKRDRKSLFQ